MQPAALTRPPDLSSPSLQPAALAPAAAPQQQNLSSEGGVYHWFTSVVRLASFRRQQQWKSASQPEQPPDTTDTAQLQAPQPSPPQQRQQQPQPRPQPPPQQHQQQQALGIAGNGGLAQLPGLPPSAAQLVHEGAAGWLRPREAMQLLENREQWGLPITELPLQRPASGTMFLVRLETRGNGLNMTVEDGHDWVQPTSKVGNPYIRDGETGVTCNYIRPAAVHSGSILVAKTIIFDPGLFVQLQTRAKQWATSRPSPVQMGGCR